MTEAHDARGKLWFRYMRICDATVIELRKNKILATFIIYDNGKLKVKLPELPDSHGQ